MTLVQIVNTILVLLLGPEVVACCWVLFLLIQRMPSHQRKALEQFAYIAVRYVKRQPERPAQKELAMGYASELFEAYKLPLPPLEIIEMAVLAAMYELEQQHG